jgi:hypothetical protein
MIRVNKNNFNISKDFLVGNIIAPLFLLYVKTEILISNINANFR